MLYSIRFVLSFCMDFGIAVTGIARCSPPGTTTEVQRVGFPSAEIQFVSSEVHDGLCGAHQSAYRMNWVIRKTGCYWPTMLEDCFEYYKGCQDCRKFGNIQRVPASALNPIIKSWPFRGWGIDLIGQINLPSSKGHKFVLLATDYFTK
jgi:hypothetical protein